MRRTRRGSAVAAAVAAATAVPAGAQDWWDQQQPWDQQDQQQGEAAEHVARHLKHEKPKCHGEFEIAGKHGSSQVLVPTGWLTSFSSEWARHPDEPFTDVFVENNKLTAMMGSRAYFANKCTPGKYDYKQYMNSNLLGKIMRFSINMTGAGCGCNAAFYMTSMGHNDHVSECFDYYCDANNVCGESCAEIDIMEANQHAFHITLHTSADPYGTASGFGGGGAGWNGPRNWTKTEYGKGKRCIDTRKDFEVAVSFPLRDDGVLEAMQVELSQEGSPCDLEMRVDSYMGMEEMTDALRQGMTPILSYWADEDMLWLDGQGDDALGPCEADAPKKCSESVQFYDFSIESISPKVQKKLETKARDQDAKMEKLHPTEPPHNWWDDQQGEQQGTDDWWDDSSTNSTTGWWENPATWGGEDPDASTEKTSSSTEWWEKPEDDSWESSDKATTTEAKPSKDTRHIAPEVIMKKVEATAGIRAPARRWHPIAAPAALAALALGAVALAARRARLVLPERGTEASAAAELGLPLHGAPAATLSTRPSSQGLLLELGGSGLQEL